MAQCSRQSGTVNVSEFSRARSSDDDVATPCCDMPDTTPLRTADECGRCAACRPRNRHAATIPFASSLQCATTAKIAGLQALPPAQFSDAKPLTMERSEAYISPLGAPPPQRDGVPAKPLTVYAVNHPARPWPRRMCGLRRLRYLPGRSCKAPGCLTSESEERETWTAESLRAASSNGEGVGFKRPGLFPGRARPWKRLRRSTFQGFLHC